jgi:DNA-binding NtrC family response regulator
MLTQREEIGKIDPVIAVIITTEIGDAETMNSALKPGAFDHITKHFNLKGLERIVFKPVYCHK